VTGPDPAVAAVRVAVRAALADLEPGSLVLVACSGGADSLALATAAVFEARGAALRVGAVTVDHGLQPGSAGRASTVATLLRDRGLDPVELVAVDVGARGGPEAAARTARYAALDTVARRTGAAAILLGHTRDDQAETVLLGLARGSGARSLAGMAPVSGRYRRPLLHLERATTRRAVQAEGLEAWEDPHNIDPAFARARVRAEALPALERSLGPGVAAALARTAGLLRADADALDGWAERALSAAGQREGSLDVVVLADLPAAVRRRVLRMAAIAAGSSAGSLAAVHIEALEALVTAWHGQGTVDLPGGVGARRACDRLSFIPGTFRSGE
jgi:tRNA(Ile)-lysidine synthase